MEENVIKLKRVSGEEIAIIPNDGNQPLGIALNTTDVDRFQQLQRKLDSGSAGGNGTASQQSENQEALSLPMPKKVDLEY